MTKIISLTKLFTLRSSFKKDINIILVTGVFDILHFEHKKLLKKAKKQGDILIVGLESNQRVRQIKGSSRPQNTLLLRLNKLASLNLADYIFKLPNLSDKNKRQVFINKLKPHILVVSSSTPHLAEKHRLMSLVKGEVKTVLPHNPNISTTNLISKR